MKIYRKKNICFWLSLVGAFFFYIIFQFVMMADTATAPNYYQHRRRTARTNSQNNNNQNSRNREISNTGVSIHNFNNYSDVNKNSTPIRNQNTFALTEFEDENARHRLQIPLKLLQQLQEIASIDELFEQLVEPGQRYRRRGLKSTSVSNSRKVGRRHRKNGGKTSKNSTAASEDDGAAAGEDSDADSPNPEMGPIFDKRAFCHPRRVPVNVPQPSDPALIYQPMCIQIERCGGCCAHELFECVPLVRRNATRKVVALRYPHSGAEYFVYEAEAKVRVERHTKCKCQCKTQPEHCSPYQHYEKQSCKCTCPQDGSQTTCKSPQVWSNQECRCRCPEYLECSTGTYFDTKSCRCRSAGEIVALTKFYRTNPVKSYF